jgi:hypothetical protein
MPSMAQGVPIQPATSPNLRVPLWQTTKASSCKHLMTSVTIHILMRRRLVSAKRRQHRRGRIHLQRCATSSKVIRWGRLDDLLHLKCQRQAHHWHVLHNLNNPRFQARHYATCKRQEILPCPSLF